LPAVLGRCEPHEEKDQKRFRSRFEILLCSPLSSLELHLRWAMGVVTQAAAGHVPQARDVQGIDWVQLLEDLSIWELGEVHRRRRDIRSIWAENYLQSVQQP